MAVQAFQQIFHPHVTTGAGQHTLAFPEGELSFDMSLMRACDPTNIAYETTVSTGLLIQCQHEKPLLSPESRMTHNAMQTDDVSWRGPHKDMNASRAWEATDHTGASCLTSKRSRSGGCRSHAVLLRVQKLFLLRASNGQSARCCCTDCVWCRVIVVRNR